MKMELETFAIATAFDNVLEAANLRLGPMTRGLHILAVHPRVCGERSSKQRIDALNRFTSQRTLRN